MKFYSPHEYQAIAQQLFDQLESDFYRIMPYAMIKINGSSMLPKAISKGDLDIYIQIPADKFEESVSALSFRGFAKKVDSGETSDFCLLHASHFEIPVDVQLVCNGSDYENLMYFVERMKNRPDLVDRYNLLKMNSKHLPEQEYTKVKTEFIYQVIENRA